MEHLTVSVCVARLNDVLTTQAVSVEGEVQGYSVSHQRWIFFSLRDEASTLECFAYAWRLPTPLEDGMTVRVLATPGIHPRSGRFRLHVERVELIGEGALRRAYELLRKKLASEGFFAPDRKRPLPEYPRRIGLVASKESAAFSDFMKVLTSRWGGLEVILTHVPVQGPEAPGAIIAALRALEQVASPVDVVVVTRGGGSLEDLQAFNTEGVARAIFRSPIPVVAAIGHERDVTIADLVADVRAATPTHAAELIVRDRQTLSSTITAAAKRLDQATHSLLLNAERVTQLSTVQLGRNFDRYGEYIVAAVRQFLWAGRQLENRVVLEGNRARSVLGVMLERMRQFQYQRRLRVDTLADLMAALNPQHILKRGFSVIRKNGRVVKSASSLQLHDTLELTFSSGQAGAEVTHL